MTSKLSWVLGALLLVLCFVALTSPALAGGGDGGDDDLGNDGDPDDIIEGNRDKPHNPPADGMEQIAEFSWSLLQSVLLILI
jgi:hypothetical protein